MAVLSSTQEWVAVISSFTHPFIQSVHQPTNQLRQPVIHTVIQPVVQRAPKPPGESSPCFNQAEEAAAKEKLNIAPFIIKRSRGAAVSKEMIPHHSPRTKMEINPAIPSPASFPSHPFTFSGLSKHWLLCFMFKAKHLDRVSSSISTSRHRHTV